MKFRKYSQDQLANAVANSTSIRQVLLSLGVAPHGGNYATVKRYIEKLKLDISHFTGQGWNKGQNFGPKRPIEDYLANRYSITSHRLRLRLIRENYFPAQCSQCKLTEWEGSPIPLELHHKNHNHKDNRLENLAIVCPNCHATLHNSQS
jgi:5-methylcytosine-specific restriction endonuclease McrA